MDKKITKNIPFLILVIISQGFNEVTVRDIGLLAIVLALIAGSKNAKM